MCVCVCVRACVGMCVCVWQCVGVLYVHVSCVICLPLFFSLFSAPFSLFPFLSLSLSFPLSPSLCLLPSLPLSLCLPLSEELGVKHTLQEVLVSLVDEATCLQLYPHVTPSQLCVGDLEGGQSVCECVSVCMHFCEYYICVCVYIICYIYIIYSSVSGCVYAGAYTGVYLQFIQDTIMESECHNMPQFEGCLFL